jgi:excisionase family DNA binding protein
VSVERLTYTVPEVAERLGVNHHTVRGAIHRGELPAVTIGRRVLVPKSALEGFLTKASVTGRGDCQCGQ